MNVMGIIFANDAYLDALTTKRTMGSLPFGGRYRQGRCREREHRAGRR